MDLKKVCRTCLAPPLPSGSVQSIFSSVQLEKCEGTKLPILTILKIFTRISVSSNDGYPDNICSDCFDKLHQSYNFKLKFERSETILKELKISGKSLNESVNSINEYEIYTEDDVEVIKTEKAEDCDSSNGEQKDLTSTPVSEQSLLKQEVPLVQEVKQEAEIEIIMEDDDFDEGTTNSRKYKCATCLKTFGKISHLEEHMRIHTGEKPFRCEVCPNTFRSKSNLNSHMRRIHGVKSEHIIKPKPKKFRCPTCSKLFGYKSHLDEHIRIHTKEKPFRCVVCPKKFRSNSNLNSHMQSIHVVRLQPIQKTNIRKFKCPTCSKLFGYRSCLLEHMRIHTGEKPFQCAECPKKFRFKRSLTEHMQTKHDDRTTNSKKYSCTTCSKLFRHKYKLDEHTRIHTGEKPFQCEMCPRKFRLKASLTTHTQKTHADITPNSKKFKCSICSKLFERNDRLDEHMRIHTGQKPFQCQVCKKNFRTKDSLKCHLQRMHGIKSQHMQRTNSRKFKCSTCSKLFERKVRLIEHMRIHTGERPFQCQVCPNKFRTTYFLKCHMQRIHDTEAEPVETANTRTFKCTTCLKLFRYKSKLNEHMRIHTGEKPFQCENCPKNFRSKSNLNGHIQRIHGMKQQNDKAIVSEINFESNEVCVDKVTK